MNELNKILKDFKIESNNSELKLKYNNKYLIIPFSIEVIRDLKFYGFDSEKYIINIINKNFLRKIKIDKILKYSPLLIRRNLKLTKILEIL